MIVRPDNLEELYHKGEVTWTKGEFAVERGFQWTPPGCHNSCGMLYCMKDGKLDHAEGDPLFPYNGGRLCARCLNLPEAAYKTRLSCSSMPQVSIQELYRSKWTSSNHFAFSLNVMRTGQSFFPQ